MATASIPAAANFKPSSRTPSSSSGRQTSPFGPRRSSTSQRNRRGTSGGGFSYCRLYISGMRSRRISSTSRKPAVVISAVRAPLCSSTALVATVVAWTTLSTCPGATPALSSSAATPSTMARP